MNFTHLISFRFKSALVTIAAIALSACGGGGSGDGSATSSAAPDNAQFLSCATYISTGFNGDLNAVYPDGWGGVPQTGIDTCNTSQQNSISGEGDAGSDGGAGDDGGSSGDGGAGGGDGGSGGGDGGAGGGDGGGDGGAGAGGGEGKIVNAQMTVTRLSDGVVLGSALTDPQRGLVTIRPRASDGPVLLTLTGRPGAQYYDEGLDRMVDFGAGKVLHALVDRFDENIGVSPLTESAYRYALANFASANAQTLRAGGLQGLTANQVRMANEAVRLAINATLDPNLQLESVKSLPTPVDSSSPEDALPLNRYGKTAMVVGGLAKAAAKQQRNTRQPNAAPPALGVTEQLAQDLTDGRVDGITAEGTPAALAAAYYEPSTLPASLADGTAEMANRFGKGTTSKLISPNAMSRAASAPARGRDRGNDDDERNRGRNNNERGRDKEDRDDGDDGRNRGRGNEDRDDDDGR